MANSNLIFILHLGLFQIKAYFTFHFCKLHLPKYLMPIQFLDAPKDKNLEAKNDGSLMLTVSVSVVAALG